MEYRRNEVTRMLHSNEEAIDDNEGPKAPPGFELFEVPVELDNIKRRNKSKDRKIAKNNSLRKTDTQLVLQPNERRNQTYVTTGMRQMAQLIQDPEMVEVDIKNQRFTWFFITTKWLDKFPNITAYRKQRMLSDHVPIFLDTTELRKIDEEESVTNLEEVELAREKALDSQLWIRVGRNERYWRQLSKCKLLKEGDRNIRYFHTLAMIKIRKRHIQQVQLNGSIVADPNEIELHIISNLRTLYKRQQVVQPDVSTLQLKRISTQQSQQLEEEVSHSQIRDVAGDCEPSMAPGHDGYNFKF
ncbi:hypothetical protein Cgig2_027315 [Carnegiea gigantea]|uniref:Uncharacterized protein n=1 Tax=Carnegiea gigantea TaxID=171969 RepID=A0A9Q1GSS7_9CARY|nr:hypothetical protein Cgig2_027315 [Carnegiea gigantea]